MANFVALNAEVAALAALVPRTQTGIRNLEAALEAAQAAQEDPSIQTNIDAAAASIHQSVEAIRTAVETIPVVPSPGTP